jgi:hypothetical protein
MLSNKLKVPSVDLYVCLSVVRRLVVIRKALSIDVTVEELSSAGINGYYISALFSKSFSKAQMA